MKFINALKLSQENNYQNNIDVISSFNFEYYKYFFNAYFKKHRINLKINDLFTNNLELNLLNYKSKNTLWIFLDWINLNPSFSFRSNKECNNFNLTEDKKIQNNLIHIINKLSYKVKEILIFAPHTRTINDYFEEINFSKSFNTINLWNSFLQKLKNLDNKKIKCVNSDLSRFEICSESIFRSNTPINIDNIQIYVKKILEIIISKSFNKKLIITDLDDTLWDGTLGDVGSEFVSWEQNDKGFKHLYFQKMLYEANKNGKILAIASKNNFENVNKVFKRKNFFLKKKYWSSIQCSWEPKSVMVSKILKELNLGEDSFIFIDNNNFELKEVRSNFPDADYLMFPKENIEFMSFVKKFYSFFKKQNSKEDTIRAQSYEAMKALNKNSSNIETFLKKIKMRCNISKVIDKNEERPFELINKTNQFNLNGIRINESDWYKFFSRNYFILKYELEDNIANHGIIGVLVCKRKNKKLIISSLVLSCRVFSRGMETVFLKSILELSNRLNLETIEFEYKKTSKNSLVKNFFSEHSIKNYKINSNFKINSTFFGKIDNFRVIQPKK